MRSAARSNATDRAARQWARPIEAAPQEADADAAAAVVAHGLLGHLAVIRGASRMLLADPGMAPGERAKLLELVETQSALVQGVLADLVRGLPDQALAALDDLRRGYS
ncbi:MAG TPA: hypothetical protein VF230_16105 [Acidimicrobiales bacterium]